MLEIKNSLRKLWGGITEPSSYCPKCGETWKNEPTVPSNIYKMKELIECRNAHIFEIRRLYKLPFLDTVTVYIGHNIKGGVKCVL